MGSLSPIHWLIVLVVILLLFGPSRLARAGQGLGEGIKSFRNAFTSDSKEDEGDPPALREKRDS
jgi:sec-independent protein translocase protein TatA